MRIQIKLQQLEKNFGIEQGDGKAQEYVQKPVELALDLDGRGRPSPMAGCCILLWFVPTSNSERNSWVARARAPSRAHNCSNNRLRRNASGSSSTRGYSNSIASSKISGDSAGTRVREMQPRANCCSRMPSCPKRSLRAISGKAAKARKIPNAPAFKYFHELESESPPQTALPAEDCPTARLLFPQESQSRRKSHKPQAQQYPD